jgi:hypothetical protein
LITGLAGIAAAVVATGALAGPADYSIVTGEESVEEGNTGQATASCPQGSSVTGGGYETDDIAHHRIAGYAPNSKRNFDVSVTNINSVSPIVVTSYAVCDETGKYTRAAGDKTFASGETKTVSARCPKGTHVAGGGVGQIVDDVLLFSSRPKGARTWQVKAKFDGAGSASLTAVAMCDHSGGEYQLRTQTEQAPPARARGISSALGIAAVAHCPPRTRASGGGWSIDAAPPTQAFEMKPGKRAWTALFLSHEGDPRHFKAYVLCKHD